MILVTVIAWCLPKRLVLIFERTLAERRKEWVHRDEVEQQMDRTLAQVEVVAYHEYRLMSAVLKSQITT
jgi:hypothetical protein